MLITAVTMVVSSGAVVIWRTNDWSIFRGVDRKLPQIAQAGVARAEIVDRQLHAAAPSGLAGRTAVDSARFIRTLSVSSSSRDAGIQARFLEDRENAFKEILVAELHRGDVHGHRRQRQARIHPGPGLPARFAQDPVADRAESGRSLPRWE